MKMNVEFLTGINTLLFNSQTIHSNRFSINYSMTFSVSELTVFISMKILVLKLSLLYLSVIFDKLFPSSL